MMTIPGFTRAPGSRYHALAVLWMLLLIGATAQAQDTHLVVLFDHSSNMARNDPHFALRQVVPFFADQLAPNSHIALFAFATETTALVPYSPVEVARPLVRQAMGEMLYHGTHAGIANAITQAMHLLQQNGSPSALQAIVLLTDGASDVRTSHRDLRQARQQYQALAHVCTKNAIRLFDIAFSDTEDYRLLQSFARQTHGDSWLVSSPADAQEALQALAISLGPILPAATTTAATVAAIPAGTHTSTGNDTTPAKTITTPQTEPPTKATTTMTPPIRTPALSARTPLTPVTMPPSNNTATPPLVWLSGLLVMAIFLWIAQGAVTVARLREYVHKMQGSLYGSPPRVSGSEMFWSWVGSFVGIAALVLISAALFTGTDLTLVIGSLGSSAVLTYGAIRSPLAQPRNLIGGHVISALIGVACYQWLPDIPWLVGAVAVSTAIAAMHATRTLHPPGGATALIAVVGSSEIHRMGWLYVLFPAALGPLILLIVAVLINNIPKTRRYPEVWF